MEKTKQPLFRRDFTLVLIGQIISLFGNAILRFALPLHLLRETGSSALFGAVSACSFLPMIVCSLAGGVLADRVNKRNIMVILDFSTAVLVLGFYLLQGAVPLVPLMIVCLMLLYGISGTYQPAVQASIPALLQRESIIRGNAAINMVGTLSGLLGPVIGGMLYGIWGIVPILLISTGCFFCSAVMEIFIRIPHQKRQAQGSLFSIIRGDLTESWRYVKTEKPVFIPVVAVLALFNLILSSAMIVGVPVMVVNFLGMSDQALGVTQGALGLGGLAGGMLIGVLSGRLKLRHSHWLLAICSLTMALMALGLAPFVPHALGYGLITLMSFTAMAASTLFTIQMCTVVQRQTPHHLIGKIMAAILALVNCAAPLGQALYGVWFEAWKSDPWAIALIAAMLALTLSLSSKKLFYRLEQEDAR